MIMLAKSENLIPSQAGIAGDGGEQLKVDGVRNLWECTGGFWRFFA